MNMLAELTARIEKLPQAEVAKMMEIAAAELARPFIPNPGPQTDAMLSKADQLLYGGAAGGGKSFLTLGLAATEHRRSLILRRESVELDGLVSDSQKMLDGRGRFVGGDVREWHLSDGRHIKLGGMKEPDDWKKYRGQARDFMAFDEAESFLENQVASLIAWVRSTVEGQRCRVIFATNPPTTAQGQWLIVWFAPWLDPTFAKPARPNELRWCITVASKTEWVDGPGTYERDGETFTAISRTFIPAKLLDNPFLASTDYAKRIDNLPEPLRSQLKYGSFTAGKEDQASQVIPTQWIDAAMARWRPETAREPMNAIGVDVAQGGADNTILAPLHGVSFGELVVRPGVATRDGPSVASLIVATRRGRAIPVIDCTGGWGGSVRDIMTAQGIDTVAFVASAGTDLRIKGGAELGFYNQRALAWWRFREALDPVGGDNIALPPDQALRAELAMPTWEVRKDKILVESKDDLRSRLGRSTDRADAVLMAWLHRNHVVESAPVTFQRRKGIV
jgi:hypothetical protein